MEVKPGYKQTEVGTIPGIWDVGLLRDLVDPTRTIRYGIVQPGKRDSNGRYMVRGQDYSKGWVDPSELFRVSPAVEEPFANARIRAGDVLITIVGASTGRIAVVPEWLDGANLTQTTARIAPRAEQVDGTYCSYVLASPIGSKQVANYLKGAAQPGLNCGDIEKFLIPLPPLPEQRAIAAALNDVDALLGGLDRLIAKKRDLKQAAMQQLLTGQTRLPGFRGEWEVKRLGEVADVLKGSALSKSLIAASGAHPCILYGELFTTYGRVISNVVSRTNSSEGCRSVEGDVLLPGSTTTTGADLATASALLIEDVALGGDIIIVRRKGNSYDPVFLASFLTHTARHEIAELTQGITIHHLYGKDLKTLSLHLPSLPEQTAIADVLSDMDAELAALEARRNKTRDLKQAMMQELLTGRTRLVKPEAAHV